MENKELKILQEHFLSTDPACLPIRFQYGDRTVCGIPEDFHPTVSAKELGPKRQTVFTGQDELGLRIRVECTEYDDYPVVEYVAYLTNNGPSDSQVVSQLKVFDRVIPGTDHRLTYSNGDTTDVRGFEMITEKLYDFLQLYPVDGTACNGASPFMRLMFREYGLNIAVGWPGKWEAFLNPTPGPVCGVRYSLGQHRCRMKIHPGETIRTPSITLMSFVGDEDRGRNLWRRWYREHVMPRPKGKPLQPKLVGAASVAGYEEFCGTTEPQQLAAIDEYVDLGCTPDLWWIDAGWYPCNNRWYPNVGSWYPDPARYPNGFGSIGEKCQKIGSDFLLWFEPERVRPGSQIWNEHPQWLLKDFETDEEQNCLLNLAIPECVDWLTDKIDAIIKDGHVTVYRQDFNFSPIWYWVKHEPEYRIGAIENIHIQGYLRFWDSLLERNPGLLIDSCAGGGRRNEMEAMRRAVPFHYTDVAYGGHPVKQKQYRYMHEWVPYFRAHLCDWRDENNHYCPGSWHSEDKFTALNSMAPAIAITLPQIKTNPELISEYIRIWRKVGALMLDGDYYPLTRCRRSAEDFYAARFEDPRNKTGCVQILSNPDNPETVCRLDLRLKGGDTYTFTDAYTGDSFVLTGEDVRKPLEVTVKPAEGTVWFYTYE